MQVIRGILATISLGAVVGLATLTGTVGATATVHAAPKPIIDAHTFDRLSALGSYHVESTWVAQSSQQKTQTVHFSEDVHGKDYHLTIVSSENGNQRSEFFYVHGNFYVGENGQYQNVGSMGKQLAQPMLEVTTGFWNALFLDTSSVHYVGRVTTSGRSADRYSVVFAYSGLTGVSGASAGVASVHFTNSVDLDVATHAPLRVVGSYSGKDNKGVFSSLKTNFLVTQIGKVGTIRVP